MTTYLLIGLLILFTGAFLWNWYSYKKTINALLAKESALQEEILRQKKEIQSLVGVVNHDLKSPFNQMFGLTSLLKMSSQLTDEHLEYIQKMDLVVRGSLRMMRNLLDLRAIDQGKMAIKRGKVLAATVVQDLKRSLSPYAEGHGVQLQWPDALPETPFLADKEALHKVLENILGNAIRFTGDGGNVRLLVRQAPQEMLWIVEDNGPGIPSEDIPLLWERYRVLSNKPKGGETAVGIGLSIAHILVLAMEGRILADSEPEKGSKFTVALPLGN
jgi:signal transduction histidine kinase